MTTRKSDDETALLDQSIGPKTNKVGLVLLLIVVVPLAAVLAVAAVMLTVGLVLGKLPPGIGGMLVAFVVCFGGALLFGSAARGLLGTIRGREVPHLVPAWAIVPFCWLLGIGTIVAVVVHPQPQSYRAGVAAGLFLAYALRETWAWVRRRRGSAGAPP
jgi:hypothetical protein